MKKLLYLLMGLVFVVPIYAQVKGKVVEVLDDKKIADLPGVTVLWLNSTLATTTELLDADVALLLANLRVTNAKADSFIAYNKLLQTAGDLK